ncbi:MAG: hypothetical protein K0S40_163 [Actinomycetospora sp.]|nr:hypothetical protein [Actinomycetospora sp.]
MTTAGHCSGTTLASGWRPGTPARPPGPVTPRSCGPTSCPTGRAGRCKIDHLSIQAWVTDVGRHRGPHTVSRSYLLLMGVLRSAVRNRLIATNPGEEVKLPKVRRSDTDERIISRHELRTALLPAGSRATPRADRHDGGDGPSMGRGDRAASGRPRPGAPGAHRDPDRDRGQRAHVVQAVPEVERRSADRPSAGVGAPGPARPPRPVAGGAERAGRRQRGGCPSAAQHVPPSGLASVPRARRAARQGRCGRRRLRRRVDRRRGGGAHQDGPDPCRCRQPRRRPPGRRAPLPRSPALVRHNPRGRRRPANMVQRVLGHERSSTTMDLYTRRTDDADRVLEALSDDDEDGQGDDGSAGVREPV